MVEFNQVLRDFSGNREPGWWITDDNSALFSPKLYATYCVPVLERVLEAMAPGDAVRYQHSDSAMGHLIPQQHALGINEVNYGPTVDAGLIREQMPDVWIRGQAPPFLVRNGSPEGIHAHIVDDFRKAGDPAVSKSQQRGHWRLGQGSVVCVGFCSVCNNTVSMTDSP